MSKLAVITFPGNNCEIESLRVAKRNGFETELIRWNQIDKIQDFDAYLLPGGFSFEDRGRSGSIAAREDIFDALRLEAQKGKLVLGICNGAQMIIESGLIPIENQALPLSLAHNIRHNQAGHTVGTGFYNDWTHLKVERTDTAFTQNIASILKVPFAHGEGRFTTTNNKVAKALESGKNVAFRYCDKNGEVSEKFPTTPNQAIFATAAVVNNEGTIMAIMPHPERFYDQFDGDKIFQSMRNWIEAKKSPQKVVIGDLHAQDLPEIKKQEKLAKNLYLSKSLIITDNECFSVQKAAEKIAGSELGLTKSIIFEVSGENINFTDLKNSGIFANPNKEKLVDFKNLADSQDSEIQYLVKKYSR